MEIPKASWKIITITKSADQPNKQRQKLGAFSDLLHTAHSTNVQIFQKEIYIIFNHYPCPRWNQMSGMLIHVSKFTKHPYTIKPEKRSDQTAHWWYILELNNSHWNSLEQSPRSIIHLILLKIALRNSMKRNDGGQQDQQYPTHISICRPNLEPIPHIWSTRTRPEKAIWRSRSLRTHFGAHHKLVDPYKQWQRITNELLPRCYHPKASALPCPHYNPLHIQRISTNGKKWNTTNPGETTSQQIKQSFTSLNFHIWKFWSSFYM